MSKEIENLNASRAALSDHDARIAERQARLKEAGEAHAARASEEAAAVAENDERELRGEKPKLIKPLTDKISDASAEVERQRRLLTRVQEERPALLRTLKAAEDADRRVRLAAAIKIRDAWLLEGVKINAAIVAIDNEVRGVRSNGLAWLTPDSVAQVIDYDRTLIAEPKRTAPPKDFVPMQADVSWVGSPAHSVFGHTSAYAAGEIAWFDKRIAAQLEKTGKWHYQPQTKSKAA
jgi:hypothetical protein